MFAILRNRDQALYMAEESLFCARLVTIDLSTRMRGSTNSLKIPWTASRRVYMRGQIIQPRAPAFAKQVADSPFAPSSSSEALSPASSLQPSLFGSSLQSIGVAWQSGKLESAAQTEARLIEFRLFKISLAVCGFIVSLIGSAALTTPFPFVSYFISASFAFNPNTDSFMGQY